ncbi:hypothetical protein, partial [Aquamicrobium defluvii]
FPDQSAAVPSLPSISRSRRANHKQQMPSTATRAQVSLEHFAAKWKHFASHKCSINKYLDHFIDSVKR